MTKFDINVIINNDVTKINEHGILKFEMEGQVVLISEKVLCSNLKKGCKDETEMNELRVDLKELINYLVVIFCKTGAKYSCTRTKIGKLLSIVAFTYAREGSKLFDESIKRYYKCGTYIRGTKFDAARDAYRKSLYEDHKGIVCLNFENSYQIADGYTEEINLPTDIKQRIEDVYCNFGSYSPNDLGDCINKLISCDGLINEDDEVDLTAIMNFKHDDFTQEEISNSTLISYLLKFEKPKCNNVIENNI